VERKAREGRKEDRVISGFAGFAAFAFEVRPAV